jgi:murein L,D-transpeptidase YcbB/YkuD
MDKRTPLFVEDMQFIEFSPYWNIPASIAKSEVVPRLRRDPAYFQAQGLEFVSAGAVVPDLTPANLDAVMHNQMKLRQRPGPANALGDIKFVFPNSDNIYLHHTPAIDLFDRNRRDFSHGCIRVEDPMALAKFVLNGQPEWTEQRIRKAMDSGKSATLRLKQRLPVVIAYATVIVKNDDRVYFFDDIYGNDKLLDMALRKEEKSRLDERKRIVKQGFSG